MSNTATSRTDIYSANVIMHPCERKQEGTMMLVKYSKGNGSSASVGITFIASRLNLTDEYVPIFLASDGISVNSQTFVFAASGNFVVPISLPVCVDKVKATVTFTGGSDQTMMVDFRDE